MNCLRSILLICCTLVAFQGLSFEGDGDTTGSSIQFVKLEATLSSQIIHFKWDVKAEEKGDFFIIEKSLDGKEWTDVKKVASIKEHKEQHTYAVSEINFAEEQTEYFRIVRVDAFGDTTELDRVNLQYPVLSNMLLIPVQKKVHKEINISYDSLISAKATLTVIGKDGPVYETKMLVEDGYNRFLLQIKNFPKGDYIVVISDEFDNKISKRLTVHK